MFPVPGPISRTVSVDLKPAWNITIYCTYNMVKIWLEKLQEWKKASLNKHFTNLATKSGFMNKFFNNF